MDVHMVPSAATDMLRNRSFENGCTKDWHLTRASLSDVLPSSIPVLALFLSWGSRFLFDRKAALRDAATIAVVSSIWHWGLLYYFISHVASGSSGLGLFATSIALLFITTVSQNGRLAGWFRTSQPPACEPSQSVVRPFMIPCQTTHTRLFPSKHSFSYSYLFVGIPVGWKSRAGTILSADRCCRPVLGEPLGTWFSVEAEDYLERGSHPDGLHGKLFEYLKSQVVAPEKYSHAFLVTAPRFLGFSFNPVSFWFLYNHADILEAMVVEVNNTFDERRIYFMERTIGAVPASKEAGRNFSHSWEKDFHVSPFNSRDGSYTIQATDPLADTNAGKVNVNCNIILSLDHKTKLVARVFSTHPALDATSMTRWQALAFVFRWSWVGLMTNPRILREARILWAKKLQVYYRPEVLKTSIGRKETWEEAQLEPSFRLLLEQLMQYSTKGLLLKYTPAAGPQRGALETIGVTESDPTSRNNHSHRGIEIRVLTPAFYSQFVRFRNWRKAFDKLCFDAPDSDRLVLISDRPTFLELLSAMEQADPGTSQATFRWRIIGWLRGKESKCTSPLLTAVSCINADDRRVCGLSQLDRLVRKDGDHVSKRRYCRNITALLVSDRLAFGWVPILRLYELVIWLFLVYFATSSSQRLVSSRLAGGSGSQLLTTLGIVGLHFWAYGTWLT